MGGGRYLTHHVLASFLSAELHLHIPFWLNFFYLGCFSYTSRAGFDFIRVVSLTYPLRDSFCQGSYVTHPVLVLFLCS